jgi:heme/copper-type cytochrome/quinol oxidase subunit 3
MLLFIFMEIMLFAGMISAHVIYLSQRVGQMWPPPGQPLLPAEQTAINTGALLASGIILFFARFGFAREPRRALVPLAMSVLLGAFFVISQGVEWVALIREGLTLTSSVYGAFFYLIVGAHALHAVAAILCLGWAWARLRKGALTAAHFDTVQLFWYFVVLVWPFLYYQVYLR